MKKIIMSFIILSLALPSILFAGDKEEIIALIMERDAYVNKNKKYPNEISKNGSLEFWSSAGLMNKNNGSNMTLYESYDLKSKHIKVIVLVPGKAAVAMFYSEGSMKAKGLPTVSHYMTRATQAFVKEGGKWKVAASHWSALQGGAGTNQTTID